MCNAWYLQNTTMSNKHVKHYFFPSTPVAVVETGGVYIDVTNLLVFALRIIYHPLNTM